MKKRKTIKGLGIELISIHGIPVKQKGVIQSMDSIGNYSVKWEDGTTSRVLVRGYVYRLYDIPQKKLFKFKNLFLSLLNKFKTFINYGYKTIQNR
jgi:hypothetical protein